MRMRFGGTEGGAPRLNVGAVLLVSDATRDNVSGWWSARGPVEDATTVTDDETSGPFFWIPAMCLAPVDAPTHVHRRPSTRDAPQRLWNVLSYMIRATTGTTVSDREAQQVELESAMEELNVTDLDWVESMIKPVKRSTFVTAHQAVHYPYFSLLLAATLILALVATLGRFGVVNQKKNPFVGTSWRGIRMSGGCWPPDVHSGHIYQPFTALIIPAGILSLLFDLLLIR
jgi:hypothetical protein